MAAATGYGDAPTEGELLAYGDLPRHGRDMAEVFAVRVPAAAVAVGGGGGRSPPCGTIFFHGGNSCSDLIFSRERSGTDELAAPQPCDSEGNLVLTGPSVATSAYGPVGFDIHLHDGTHGEPSLQADGGGGGGNDQDDSNNGRVFCDTVSGEFSTYDRVITETVATGYGPANVVYAVLSNAVQGRVAVKLTALPAGDGADAATGVLGRVVARSKLLDAGCVLFYGERDGEGGVPVRPGDLLPLARQALAVPLHKPLTIELNLRSDSGEEIVRGAVEFDPAITGEHIERVVGTSGAEMEVTVSWSDYPW